MKLSNLSVRIDPELRGKFQYISRYEGRSMNGQILLLIQRCVREFEREHGPITEEDLRQSSNFKP